MTVIFGTCAQATAVTILAPSRGDAAGLRRLAHHEAGDVLQEQQRDLALAGQLDEVRGLQRRLRIEDAVVGQDRHRQPLDVGEAGHQRLRVVGLELVHLAAVDQPGDDLARVVLRHQRGRHHAVELGRVVGRRARLAQRDVDLLHRIEVGDDVAHDLQRVLVVERVVVGDAGLARVHLGAAQLLRAHASRRWRPSPAAGRRGRSCPACAR